MGSVVPGARPSRLAPCYRYRSVMSRSSPLSSHFLFPALFRERRPLARRPDTRRRDRPTLPCTPVVSVWSPRDLLVYEYPRPPPTAFTAIRRPPFLCLSAHSPYRYISKTFEARPDPLECAQVPRPQNTGILARSHPLAPWSVPAVPPPATLPSPFSIIIRFSRTPKSPIADRPLPP